MATDAHIIEGGADRYVVDGHEYPEDDSALMGDGAYPPFRIFDILAQDYVGVTYQTREAAEPEAARLSEAFRAELKK